MHVNPGAFTGPPDVGSCVEGIVIGMCVPMITRDQRRIGRIDEARELLLFIGQPQDGMGSV